MIDSNPNRFMLFDVGSYRIPGVRVRHHVVRQLTLEEERVAALSIPLHNGLKSVLCSKGIHVDIVTVYDCSVVGRVIAVFNKVSSLDMVCPPEPEVVADNSRTVDL
jgi:hypothetical protein